MSCHNVVAGVMPFGSLFRSAQRVVTLSLLGSLWASAILMLACCEPGLLPDTSWGTHTLRPSSVAVVSPAPAAAEISAALRESLQRDPKRTPGGSVDRAILERVYDEPTANPLWLDAQLRPTQSGHDAVAIITAAAADGLDPADYGAARLNEGLRVLDEGRGSLQEAAAFDLELSEAMVLYLRHFHRGRVNPRDMGFQISVPTDEHDYALLVRRAALSGRVKETVASMEPRLVQYRSLRSALAMYRELASLEGTTTAVLPPKLTKSIRPGDVGPLLEPLRNRLVTLRDLEITSEGRGVAAAYDGELLEAVKRFQMRHGLAPDGVLGQSTWNALNVPLTKRTRQIELAMERLRWLPHLDEHRFIAVNIPMFRLWAWDMVPPSGTPDFGTGVIVGKALDTRTPVFVEEMRHVVFRPYWNVPRSILRNEILPILRTSPGYLESHDMEIVSGQGDDAKPVAASADSMGRLADGTLRLRQRPGPKNALGSVVFVFPNDDNVYMHGTPAPELFGRARRDLSHGCVRVEDPTGLAQWVLKDEPGWDLSRILAAMEGRPSFRVPLSQPIRVIMYYVTAAVMPEDGSIHFAEDIYGHDLRLERALTARNRRAALPGPDAAGVDVNEVRARIEPNAATPLRDRRSPQLRERHVRQPDVDRLADKVQAATRDTVAVTPKSGIRGGRPVRGDDLEGCASFRYCRDVKQQVEQSGIDRVYIAGPKVAH